MEMISLITDYKNYKDYKLNQIKLWKKKKNFHLTLQASL